MSYKLTCPDCGWIVFSNDPDFLPQHVCDGAQKISDEVLQVKRDRILKAAKGCPDVEKAMKTLFPEVFVDDKIVCTDHNQNLKVNGYVLARVRQGGNYCGRSFYLTSAFDWSLAVDDHGHLVLLPSRKK